MAQNSSIWFEMAFHGSNWLEMALHQLDLKLTNTAQNSSKLLKMAQSG